MADDSTEAQRLEREIFHLSLQDQNNIYNISVPGLTPDCTGRPVSDDTKALLANIIPLKASKPLKPINPIEKALELPIFLLIMLWYFLAFRQQLWN